MTKTITGIVSSKRTDKTIVVTVQVRLTHPLYRKQYTVTKRFMAHDEKNEANEGDKVVIAETRPLSARKRFALRQVIRQAGVEHVESENPLEAITGSEPKDVKQAAGSTTISARKVSKTITSDEKEKAA